ncbi:MAG TPA: replicative DNA helicase, partial [bacterium]|nr:replicative DNA helicase [bacterium]
DQLSKIKGDRRKSKFEEATSIVEQLADLKKELRMPVVLLAQINRRAEDRDNKKPTLADLKNTGQIEEDADIVLIGHRPYEYTKLEEHKHQATWEIAKNRGGPCRNVDMMWYPKITTFSDAGEI